MPTLDRIESCYRNLLDSKEAIAFLQERKISPAMWRKYALGADKDTMSRLRHRLLFPIRDVYGEHVAWQGRALRDEMEPKYWGVRVSQSPMYASDKWKSRVLYGLYECYEQALKKGYLLLNEGNICVLSHAMANSPAVALQGSGMSHYQAYLIRRYVTETIYYIDDNPAGHKAGYHAAAVLQEFGVTCDLRLQPFVGITDTNELLMTHGLSEVANLAPVLA